MKKLLSLFIAVLILIDFTFRNNLKDAFLKPSTLSRCINASAKIHHHVILKITVLGKVQIIPAGIGIKNGCMSPIDTHDSQTGRVHIHYYEDYPFTLGDFFTMWGIPFDNNQFDKIKTGNKYKITMKVNNKINLDYGKYILKDNDYIEIHVDK